MLHNVQQRLHCIALYDTKLIYFFPPINAFKHCHALMFHLFLLIRFQTTDGHGCHRAESTPLSHMLYYSTNAFRVMNIHNNAPYMQHKDIRKERKLTFECKAMKKRMESRQHAISSRGESFRSLSLSFSVSEPLSLSLSQLSYRLLFPG